MVEKAYKQNPRPKHIVFNLRWDLSQEQTRNPIKLQSDCKMATHVLAGAQHSKEGDPMWPLAALSWQTLKCRHTLTHGLTTTTTIPFGKLTIYHSREGMINVNHPVYEIILKSWCCCVAHFIRSYPKPLSS